MTITPDFSGYKVRFAAPEEYEDVLAFYSDEHNRTPAVYQRKPEIVKQQVENGLFLTVRNEDERIIAASSVYPLAGGQRIDCVSENNSVIERGRVAEIGSVLRWGDKPNGAGNMPSGFWHPLLVGAMMVEVFRRGDTDIEADLLVGNIQTDRTQNIRRLTGKVELTPFSWDLFEPAPALEQAFGDTTDDPNKQRTKQYFRAKIRDLPNVAAYLLKSHQRGYLTNKWGAKLGIDMSGLPIHTLDAILKNKLFFAPRSNGNGNGNGHYHDNRSWSEAARQFRERAPEPRLRIVSSTSSPANGRIPVRPVDSETVVPVEQRNCG